MSRRPSNGNRRKESPDHVGGSIFKEKQPLLIPSDLDQSTHDQVRTILDQNPYLEQAQVASAVRLAKLYFHFDQIERELTASGYTVETSNGGTKPNPMVSTLTSLQNAIVTQERNLAISVPTRNEQISKADRNPAPAADASKDTAGVGGRTPRLRLA